MNFTVAIPKLYPPIQLRNRQRATIYGSFIISVNTITSNAKRAKKKIEIMTLCFAFIFYDLMNNDTKISKINQ